MECETLWFTISICWISFLMILTIYYLENALLLQSFITAVLVVVEISSITLDPDHLTPAASFVILAEWYNLVACIGRQCTEMIAQGRQATISAFITGTSESLNYFLWRVRYLMSICYRLRRSYVMARTPLSTKTQCAKYSDL